MNTAVATTEGLVKELLSIFTSTKQGELGGEALAMLALESNVGCPAILKRAEEEGE
jgi:hypothetical protein